MAAIGSLVFCTACGNLLDGPAGDKKAVLVCELCGMENTGIVTGASTDCLKALLSLPSRYFINLNHYDLQTLSLPFCFAFEEIGCSNVD